MKIKNLKIFMLATTAAVTLNMTGCSKQQAHDLITYVYSEDGSIENQSIFHKNVRSITIGQDQETNDYILTISNLEEIIDIDLQTIEEVYEFIEQCPNLGYLVIENNATEILKRVQNPKEMNRLEITGEIEPEVLERFTNLVDLQINSTSITSLKEIAKLKKLKYLTLENTMIQNIDDLQYTVYLTQLDLENNKNLQNIEGLKHLKNLIYLDLSNTKVEEKDLEVLKKLRKLQTLELNDLDIKSIDFLEHLKDLKKLSLKNANISDFHTLEQLKQLQHLDLTHTNLQSLYPLRNLQKLEYLYLDWNELEDISILMNEFPELKTVSIIGNKISKSQIQELNITRSNKKKEDVTNHQRTNIKNIEISYSLTFNKYYVTVEGEQENSIDLQETTFSDISLENIIQILNTYDGEKITYINIPEEDTKQIIEASPKNIKSIKYMGENPESITKYLQEQPNLEQLIMCCTENSTFDINSIQGLEQLVWLNITADTISHTENLENLKNLQLIILRYHNIDSQIIENTAKIPEIKYIELKNYNQPITDYTPLRNSNFALLLTNRDFIIHDTKYGNFYESNDMMEEINTIIQEEDVKGLKSWINTLKKFSSREKVLTKTK